MVSFVKGYFRGQHRPAYIKMHEQLWNEFVGNVLSMELLDRLAEPLDGEEFDDLSSERKSQMRETM
jgi:hypothetical protein